MGLRDLLQGELYHFFYQEKWRVCPTECENFLSNQDPFLEKIGAAVCIWLEDESQ